MNRLSICKKRKMSRCKSNTDARKQCKTHTIHESGLCWRHDPDQYFLCGGSNPDGSTCKKRMKTDKRCNKHGGKSSITKPEEKKFQCVATIRRGSNKGKRCHVNVEIEDGLCGKHSKKEIIRIEHSEEKCDRCGKPVEWASMRQICDYYDISTVGQIYSYRSHKYLEGTKITGSYRSFTLINNDGKHILKGMHTFQGIIFYGLPIDNDNRGITVDHIDRVRDNNRICCNLRPTIKSEQSKNRIVSKTYIGKTVLKICSKTGDVIEKYKSAVEAAKKNNVENYTMNKVCQKERRHIGYLWRYENKSDYGDIEWISSTKEFPDMPPFEGSENGDILLLDGRISKGTKCSNGYKYIGIDSKTYRVHILICTLFHGPKPTPNHQVSHKKSKGDDNRACNLEWATQSENSKTTTINGMNKSCKPVRALYKDGTHKDFTSGVEACRLTGASRISSVINGKRITSGRDSSGNPIRWEAIVDKVTS